VKVRLAGDNVTEGAVPLPLNDTLCGLPLALSVMVIAPLRVPTAVGVNITEIVQLAPTLRLFPQVFVWLKSPLARTLLIVRVVVPELVSVTFWALLLVPTCCEAKVRLVGDKPTPGAVPVPLRETISGLSVALSVIVNDSFRTPVVAGLKLTIRVQLVPAATELPQLFVWL